MKTRSAMLVISETLYSNKIKILTEGKDKQQRMSDWFPVFNTVKQFARKRSSGSSRIKQLRNQSLFDSYVNAFKALLLLHCSPGQINKHYLLRGFY